MNDYEKNLEQLQKISDAFTSELSLEQSVELFEKGVKAAGEAVRELKKTYGKILELKQEMDGVFAEPFEGDKR